VAKRGKYGSPAQLSIWEGKRKGERRKGKGESEKGKGERGKRKGESGKRQVSKVDNKNVRQYKFSLIT